MFLDIKGIHIDETKLISEFKEKVEILNEMFKK